MDWLDEICCVLGNLIREPTVSEPVVAVGPLASPTLRNRVVGGPRCTPGLEDRACDTGKLAEYFAPSGPAVGVRLIITGGYAPNCTGWLPVRRAMLFDARRHR